MRGAKWLERSAPTTVAGALAELGDERARAVAGGTDLLPRLGRGQVDARVLVDLSRIDSLRGIEPDGDGGWRLGAGTTLAAIARDEALARALPAIAQAAAGVAGPAHRTAATLGGNLCQDTRCVFSDQGAWWRGALGGCLKRGGDTCHVAPQGRRCHAAFAGDLAPALMVHDAQAVIAGPDGTRRVALADLYRDDGAAHLALRRGELLVALDVPPAGAARAGAYRKVRARGAIDFPLAGVAVAVRRDAGRLAELVVAVTGTQPRPILVRGLDALLGRGIDDDALLELDRQVQRQVTPMRTTVTAAHHRRRVAAATARRLLAELARETRPEDDDDRR
jgi:4-hydroxybenzoyl-CoA reductase subunit beta